MYKWLLGPADWALLPLRLVVGVTFALHGAQKLFGVLGGRGMDAVVQRLQGAGVPAPEILAWVVAVVELGGGVAVVLGAFTRWAALALIAVMAVALFAVHFERGSFAPLGDEQNLVLIGALVALVIAGGQRLSVDAALAERRRDLLRR